MDLDKLIAKVTGAQLASVPQQVPRPPGKLTRALAATKRGKPSEAITALRHRFASPEIRAAWAAYRKKPSNKQLAARWTGAVEANTDSAYAYLLRYPGPILAALRRRLPNTVPTPRSWPPDRTHIGQKQSLKGWAVAAEAFAGGGLFSLALAVEGVYVGEVCEIDKWAVETLKTNLHSTAVATDALEWTPFVDPKRGLDLLVGGPPCQPFSKGREHGGGIVGPADPRNMYPRVLEWVADAQPRIVCLENSAQLTKKPALRKYMIWWLRQLAALGYEGVFWTLSAASFGTPQNRQRAWAVCWPKGAPWGDVLRHAPPSTHGRPGTDDVVSGDLLPWTRAFDRLNSGCCAGWGLVSCVNLGNLNGSCSTCVDAIQYSPAPNQSENEVRLDLSDAAVDVASAWKNANQLRLESYPPVEASAAVAWHQLKVDERRLTRYLSPVVTGEIRKGAPYGLLVPAGADDWGSIDKFDPASVMTFVRQLKRMGVRDAAKLQDVPQWYALMGPKTAQFMQLGNGIPVNMGRAVTRHLLSALRRTRFDPVPMARRVGWGSNQPGELEGLWPLDRVDSCAGYTGILGYPDAVPPHQARTRAITSQQRRQRPYASAEVYDEVQGGRQAMRDRTTRWDYRPGSGEYYVHDPSWAPRSMTDPPPGFVDLHEFAAWVGGEDLVVQNHYVRLYRGVTRPGQRLAGWMALDLGAESAYPDWSRFHPSVPQGQPGVLDLDALIATALGRDPAGRRD